MSMSPKLVLRQSQALQITPQLMQAIKLLQLSSLELSAFVDEELRQNPLLERDERDQTDDQDAYPPERTADDAPVGDTVDWASNELEVNAEEVASNVDVNADDLYPEHHAAVPGSASTHEIGQIPATGDDRRPDIESFASKQKSLNEHLTEQFMLLTNNVQERLIGSMLIDAIDENGYLQAKFDDLTDRLGVQVDRAHDVLGKVQTLEPTGVGARDLAECLAIQLKAKNRFDPAMRCLVENLDRAAKRDFAFLRKVCGVDDDDLAEMLAELRALDPKPGRQYSTAIVETVIPDIVVEELPNGAWSIELNPEALPKVLVNRTYYAQIKRGALSADDKTYLSEQLQSANWLVKSIDQRARTMIKVGQEIVRQQDRFLAFGVDHLRPLTLKQVADAVDLHESTISRVTSNKYMATPRGVFELKYFFTAAIQSTDGGEAHAAEAVRQRIKKLIDAEDPKKVLSDDQLVAALKGEGIDIARRTVAKYREAMRIASSVQRRREKRAVMLA